MQVFRSEIKVGLFILAALVLLSFGIFIASDLSTLLENRNTLVVLFSNVDGITKGSPVWYAGFEVGEVSKIQIAEDTRDRIAVTLGIDPKARVRLDSRIEIRNLGMMGSKYVEISPGSPESPEIDSKRPIVGKDPSSLTTVIETGQLVATRLVTLAEETQALIHDIRTESSLKEAIQNGNGLLVEMREQGKDLKPLLQKLSTFADTLNQTGQHLQKASGEGGKELTALLKELRDTNHGIQKRIENVEGHLTNSLGEMSKGFSEAQSCATGIRSVVASSEKDLMALLENLRETSRHMEALSEDLRAHPWKIIWKENGTYDLNNPMGSDQWREKGRIGPHGKE